MTTQLQLINIIIRRELSSSFFYFFARHVAEGNSRHSDRNITFFSFLVGLRIYEHPCNCTVNVLVEQPVAHREIVEFSHGTKQTFVDIVRAAL